MRSVPFLPTIRPVSGSANHTGQIETLGDDSATRRHFFPTESLHLFARSLHGSGLPGALLQLILRQVYVPHRLRDHYLATRNFVIR